MPNVFNAAEIVDMGIEKEKKRRDFYALVAEKFKEKDLKDLFLKLRNWEDDHIKKFTAIRNSVKGEEIAESYQGEFGAYIKALVDDKLYSQVSAKEFEANVKTARSAIQYSLGFEKDAILLFNELLRYMETPGADKVRELIEEEKKHIIYLAELKRKYE